jgi:hypothetical protein
MTIFMPWFGHFGDLVRDVLPWIWAHYQPGDIIGGNPCRGGFIQRHQIRACGRQ